jgi:Tol biopolymer transport system component
VDVWKLRPDGSGAVNLTADTVGNDAFPDFSPDGRRLVFRSGRDGNSEVYLMNADGGRPRRLTHHPATDTMPAFSPRGDQVAFTSNRGGDFDLYVLAVGPDGAAGEPRRVAPAPGLDMHPKYSPDGAWLVFASERGGINDEEPLIPIYNPQPYGEIWAVRLGDGRTVRLTHNAFEDGTPAWGRAGPGS